MTYSFSNSDLVAKRWLTCLFKTKKGSKNCEIPPPPPHIPKSYIERLLVCQSMINCASNGTKHVLPLITSRFDTFLN